MVALTLLSMTAGFVPTGDAAESKPLKVYILAGQSNMQGHAKIETIDYLGDDPATAPLLKEMRDDDGNFTVSDDVWISYLTGSKEGNGEVAGKLTTGFGARRNPGESDGKIGPEFTFGLTVDKGYDGPILLIKTAWGGKSLHTDFRPPSSGPYEFNQAHLETLEKRGKDLRQVQSEKKLATGHYYRLMIQHIQKVLSDPQQVVPTYDASVGYELAGFVWFQGWNDKVDRNTYPRRTEPGGYDLYSQLMANFIRDVRNDLSAPQMPFVIGVMGVGGLRDQPEYFRDAMAAPSLLPEFKQNVTAVPTAPYWDQPLSDLSDEIGAVNKTAYYLKKNEPKNVIKDPIAAEILKKYLDGDKVMPNKRINEFVKEYRSVRIGASKEEMWKRGASNAGYHYLGCAKTFALIGQAFGEACLEIEKRQASTR
jgi:alpha-galactosidase